MRVASSHHHQRQLHQYLTLPITRWGESLPGGIRVKWRWHWWIGARSPFNWIMSPKRIRWLYMQIDNSIIIMIWRGVRLLRLNWINAMRGNNKLLTMSTVTSPTFTFPHSLRNCLTRSCSLGIFSASTALRSVLALRLENGAMAHSFWKGRETEGE